MPFYTLYSLRLCGQSRRSEGTCAQGRPKPSFGRFRASFHSPLGNGRAGAIKRRREVMLVVPFRGFGPAARPSALPPRNVLPGELPVQSYRLRKYRRYWFGDPTLPLAISSAVWFSFRGLRRPQLSERRIHSSSLASRESYPAVPSRPASANRLLSWASCPFSTCRNRGSTSRGFCLPATFRLQGLATLLTASAPRFRAGLVSYRQRSWDSPFGAFSSAKGIRPVSGWKNPPAVSSDGIPAPKCKAGSSEPRLLGFDPSGSP